MFRFGYRPAGHFEVSNRFRSRTLAASLGNGCGDGECGTAQLSRHHALLGIRDGGAKKIHVPRKYSGARPDPQVSESCARRNMADTQPEPVTNPSHAESHCRAVVLVLGWLGWLRGTKYYKSGVQYSGVHAARIGNPRRADSITPPPSTVDPAYITTDCPGVIAEAPSARAISTSASSTRTNAPRTGRARCRI